jgi:hypothetical protein
MWRASGFIVQAEKKKSRGLYLCWNEVVTPNYEERVLRDIHCASGKRLPEERIFD